MFSDRKAQIKFWTDMYDQTTERVMELKAIVKNAEDGIYHNQSSEMQNMFAIKKSLEAGEYLHSLSYLNMKELQ